MSATTSRSTPRLSERLDGEWAVISRRWHLIDHARSWELGTSTFDDLDGLLRLAGYGAASNDAADGVLLRLVELAASDDLAGRVVLQRILPGLLATCRRRRLYGDVDAFEEIVGAAWIVIRSFRTDHRRTHIAGTLVRDAAYRAFVGPTRRRWSFELAADPTGFDELPMDDARSSHDELARVLRDAEQDGVPSVDVELMRSLVRDGSRAVAAERKVTMRTVRNHRDRVATSIREAAVAADRAA